MPDTTIRTPAVDFHAVIQGAQPRVVFVHGLGGDLRTWDALWAAMGGAFAGLRYDLRGFGKTTVHERAPFNHADDLLALLDASGIERCHLVGVSMGASIALNFTLDHPDRVRSLVLISPGLVAWEFSPEWVERQQKIVAAARSGSLDEAKRLWWEDPLFETTRRCAAAPVLYEAIQADRGEQWLHDDHVLMLPDVERLHQLTTPTLLLTGMLDQPDFQLIADLIGGSASNITRIDLPERGHLLHLEDPERCAQEINASLRNAAGR